MVIPTKISKISFSGKRDVSLYRLEGSGHSAIKIYEFWRNFGGNTKEISAADEILALQSLTLKSSMSNNITSCFICFLITKFQMF